MRRPHPYLAVALVCAAVVLATLVLACPARAERGTTPVGPRPTPAPPAPLPTPTQIPVVNGIAIWPGSPECEVYGPITYYPTIERVREIQLAARWAIAKELDAGAMGWNGITPEGLKTSMSGLEWQAVLAFTYENFPTFYDRPLFGAYKPWPGATPNCIVGDTPLVCICAQGVGRIHPEIALDQPSRTERLIAWETLNSLVCAVRRCELADSTYISTLMKAIEPRVGGWKTAMKGNPGDAAPRSTGEDVGNGRLADSVDRGYSCGGFAPPVASDYFENGSAGEDGAAGPLSGRHQKKAHRVIHVLAMGDGLQVLQPVVCLDAVDVVDLFAGAKRADERLEDETVDERHPAQVRAEAREVGLLVPIRVGLLPHERLPESESPSVSAAPAERITLDPADAGSGVHPFGTGDDSPAFSGDLVYGTIRDSHREPPTQVPVVRSGWDAPTSRRAAFILANHTHAINSSVVFARVGQQLGGWSQ